MEELHLGETKLENIYKFNIKFEKLDPFKSSHSYREYNQSMDPERLETL